MRAISKYNPMSEFQQEEATVKIARGQVMKET